MTPLTPSKTGCKASVYRGFDALAPLNIKNPSKSFPTSSLYFGLRTIR